MVPGREVQRQAEMGMLVYFLYADYAGRSHCKVSHSLLSACASDHDVACMAKKAQLQASTAMHACI